jgi:hypothetical protein
VHHQVATAANEEGGAYVSNIDYKHDKRQNEGKSWEALATANGKFKMNQKRSQR